MTGRSRRGDPEARREKIAGIHKVIEQSVEGLAEALDAGRSEGLQAFLAAMARFHSYSFQNVMLIVSQRPDATRVAGFHTWRSLRRAVRKGEKGIAIFAPMMLKAKADDTARPASDEEPDKVLRFRVVHVFDISQTDGEPLPDLDCVRGDVSDLLPRLDSLVAGHGVELTEEELGGADGVSRGGSIALRPGLEPAQRFSVLVHELAHELLHKTDSENRPPKTVRETEAEAVAHVVSDAMGLETGSAAADYISLYSGDRELLMASLDRIQRAACRIIEGLQYEQEPESLEAICQQPEPVRARGSHTRVRQPDRRYPAGLTGHRPDEPTDQDERGARLGSRRLG